MGIDRVRTSRTVALARAGAPAPSRPVVRPTPLGPVSPPPARPAAPAGAAAGAALAGATGAATGWRQLLVASPGVPLDPERGTDTATLGLIRDRTREALADFEALAGRLPGASPAEARKIRDQLVGIASTIGEFPAPDFLRARDAEGAEVRAEYVALAARVLGRADEVLG